MRRRIAEIDRCRRRGTAAGLIGCVVLLAACATGPATPFATVPLSVPVSPSPVSLPTATPIPPVLLTLHWPDTVSALEDVMVSADLAGLSRRDENARVVAFVSDPSLQIWWIADLEPVGDGVYAAPTAVHLPLVPMPGEWQVRVRVSTTVPISGEQAIHFVPQEVPLWDLAGNVPSGVTLQVPRAFHVVRTEGDLVAGRWVWEDALGEVALWWAPGPAESLTDDTAQMMLEATLPASWPVDILTLESGTWQGLPALFASERWPQGPAESVLVQGPDRWLYLLRVRALGEETIPTLLHEIRETFRVTEG